MYSQFFGLRTPPFGITPDTSFFYSGGEREVLISAIAYGITHGDGIIKVVGEVGSGKTMLSRMLARQLPDNINLVFLLNPSLQASDLIFAIGHELDLQFDRDCSKNYALQLVQNKLLAMHAAQKRVVVFIDEAQCMPLETLEELRLLSNLETETDKLLQLVLFGQPELDEHLAHTSVRQIKERIIHSFYLKPFSRDEVGEYLSFRLHKAGYNGSPIFNASALKLLTRFSSGLPRKLTILADKSLLAAFAAQSSTVKALHVRLAAKDSGQYQSGVTRQSMALIAILFALLIVATVFYNLPYSGLNGQKAKDTVRALIGEESLVADVSGANNQSLPQVITQQPVSEPATMVTLETLSQKTQRWMTSSSGAVYTIQILSANIGDDEFLEVFFSNVAQHIGLDELYVHPVSVDEKKFLAITLGGFSTHSQATTYLNSLPSFILRYQPYIKNIASFKRLD
jgi:type II secretory pathway predicted ATPase ExeA